MTLLEKTQEIDDFAQVMHQQVHRHVDEYGRAWKHMDPSLLLHKLHQNLEELEIAVKYQSDVNAKAADVANLAMMVADSVTHGSTR